LETVTKAIARLRVFADAAWSTLAKDGYKPYTRAYTWFPEEGDDWEPYAALDAGYWRPAKGPIYTRYLGVSLDCFDLDLSIHAGWSLKKNHPEYDAHDWWDYLECWPAKASRDLFRRPTHESLERILPELNGSLKKFKGTKYYKAR
jgi:hypothetical protein